MIQIANSPKIEEKKIIIGITFRSDGIYLFWSIQTVFISTIDLQVFNLR